ncbi:OapA N-terminal domain-containing protein, partial [Vibrio sp. 16]|uniref:OapA N-terminal domain-containing protein n=1 Tax=Vibrio sp. 16 TaxID=391586 RepID=UPI002FC3D5F8
MFPLRYSSSRENVRFRSTFIQCTAKFDLLITQKSEISYTHVRLVFILGMKPAWRCDAMNRRKKKKQPSVNYIELMKQKWSSIDGQAMKDKVAASWALLPKLHQRALMVLLPIVLLLILIPF